jgi:hypothetical protein
MIIKPLGVSNSCNSTSANTYANSTLVRVTYEANSNMGHTVYCYSNSSTLKYSIRLCGSESIILEKSPTDLINSTSVDTSVQIVPVAYKN